VWFSRVLILDQKRVRELALRLDATGRSQGSEPDIMEGSDLDRPVHWRDGARRAQRHPSQSGHQTKGPAESGAP
jgi:hypothetical protein